MTEFQCNNRDLYFFPVFLGHNFWLNVSDVGVKQEGVKEFYSTYLALFPYAFCNPVTRSRFSQQFGFREAELMNFRAAVVISTARQPGTYWRYKITTSYVTKRTLVIARARATI